MPATFESAARLHELNRHASCSHLLESHLKFPCISQNQGNAGARMACVSYERLSALAISTAYRLINFCEQPCPSLH